MSNIIIPKELDMADKLALMNEDAQYEVGVDGEAESTALLCAADIKGRPGPPKVPKMFLSSACVFNCAYCGNRCGREERTVYSHTSSELAKIAVDAAKMRPAPSSFASWMAATPMPEAPPWIRMLSPALS